MAVRTTLARSVGLALAACSGGAWAGDFNYSLFGTVEHSDNIGLTSNNQIGSNVLMPGVNFSYTEQGSTLQANVTGSLEYRDYSTSAYDNQTLAQVSALANWAMVPQRLDLYVQDDKRWRWQGIGRQPQFPRTTRPIRSRLSSREKPHSIPIARPSMLRPPGNTPAFSTSMSNGVVVVPSSR